MVMRPASASSNWFKQRRKVLLPQPLGPMSTTASPLFCEWSIPCRTRVWWYDLTRFSTTIMAKPFFQPVRQEGGRVTQGEIDGRGHDAQPDVIIGGHRQHAINLGQFNHRNDRHNGRILEHGN